MSNFKIKVEAEHLYSNNKRIRKGIYKDLYRNIESNRKKDKISFSSNKKLPINDCFRSFGEGFVSSLKSMFQSPKSFISGLVLISAEWYLSTRKNIKLFSKLGLIAGVSQLAMSLFEIKNSNNVSKSLYYAGSGISTLGFSNKYTSLINCSGIIINKNT